MTKAEAIAAFVAQPVVALVGASRSGKKFGNLAARTLRSKGYRVHLVHPQAEMIDSERSYRSLAELPEPVTALVVVVPPKQAYDVVGDAAAAGIRMIWLQQGSEAPDIVDRCRERGLSVVAGECILMYAQPTGVHRLHRGLWRLLRKLPA